MAEPVVHTSCAGFAGPDDKGAGQLIEPPVDLWRPPHAYLETSLDDLSYSSHDSASSSGAATPAASSTPEPSSNQTTDHNRHFLPNDHPNHQPGNHGDPGSRQSADDAVERRLMEQIQSEQEARHRIEQEQSRHRQHLLTTQNHHQQQEAGELRQQVSPSGSPGKLDSQQQQQQQPVARRQLQQQTRQRCNTFGRPHQQQQQPVAADGQAHEQPPAVPVRRSSQLASRRTPVEQPPAPCRAVSSRPSGSQHGLPFRRPSRSPPPPPLPPLASAYRHNTLPAQRAPEGRPRVSRRPWSAASSRSSSSGGAGSPPAHSASESSLNNLNALASNSTGEAARTLADCSTPSPQSTVVEGGKLPPPSQLNQLAEPVVGGGPVLSAGVQDGLPETQIERGSGAPPAQAPPSVALIGGPPQPKQKPVAGDSSVDGRSRSRSVVSLLRLSSNLAGSPDHGDGPAESAPSRAAAAKPQQPMRSFSLAAPPCLAGADSHTHRARQQQLVADSDSSHQTVAELHMNPNYWKLSGSESPGVARGHEPNQTTDIQLYGYALVDRGRKLSAPANDKLPVNTSKQPPADQAAGKSGPPDSDDGGGAQLADKPGNNAIARGGENPFLARLYESCSPPPAATCANLCRLRADKGDFDGQPLDLAIALMASDDEDDDDDVGHRHHQHRHQHQHHNNADRHHQEQQVLMMTGDARQQEPLQLQERPAQAGSRLQDEWLRSMYRQMHRPSAENRHLKALNSAQHQHHQQHQELPIRIQLKADAGATAAYPPTYSPTSDSDSFDAPFIRRRPSDSPQASSGTVSDYLAAETSHERNLSLYYKLIEHIDDAFSSVLTDVNSRSSHTLQAPKRSRNSKLQGKTSKSGPQTPVAGRSSNDQSSSIRVGAGDGAKGCRWPQAMSTTEQHERRCVFSQLLKNELITTTTTTKLPLKDTCDQLSDETDQHKQYLAVQAGCDIPLKGLRKPAPPASDNKDHLFSNESVHIHYRTPTGKLLKMNTLNEFELNRLKKLYGKQVASGSPIERSKSSWLSSAAQPLTGGTSRRSKGAEDSSGSPFVDLHRYQRAFLQPGRAGAARRGPGARPAGQGIRFGRALFDFQAKSGDELSLRRGDLVELVEVIDHAWAKVEDCQSGLAGLVPLNYIDYNVGCAVAKRDVSRHRGPARLNSTAANEQAYEQHLLPMSKGEPITLIRRLSGHLYEASNTHQARGLVCSRDLDIIKQPVLRPDTGLVHSGLDSDYCPTRAAEDQELQDDEEEMLILESGEQFLARRRRARSASGRPSAPSSQPGRQDCSCTKDCRFSSAPAPPDHGQPPRRSSSSPYISQLQQQPPVSPARAVPKLPQVYRAKYAYQPRQRDELELVAGDLLLVMHTCDDGWFIGTSYSTNQMGTFPGNFVEPV